MRVQKDPSKIGKNSRIETQGALSRSPFQESPNVDGDVNRIRSKFSSHSWDSYFTRDFLAHIHMLPVWYIYLHLDSWAKVGYHLHVFFCFLPRFWMLNSCTRSKDHHSFPIWNDPSILFGLVYMYTYHLYIYISS